MPDTLVTVDTLRDHLGDERWAIVDCRHDLADAGAGRRAYLAAHIPGAVFADIKTDLSGPPVTNRGRHPLPTPEALRTLFGRLGIDGACQVVAYDDAGGSFAARLWWLLRYMGHGAAAVLDGGWQAWQAAGQEVRSGDERRPPRVFSGARPRQEWVVSVEEVPRSRLLIDSRDPARYRGEIEPFDPKAGHIPGAINRFWKLNLDERGRFKPAEKLRAEFADLLGGVASDEAVFYCGSGVTACHNLLAAADAGLALPRLYAGSWSEWCADPQRPVAVGPGP